MSLTFFADPCVPSSVIYTLQNAGYTVLILREHLPPDSEDALVVAKAQELNSILVSLNGDFADITTYPPARYQGIITLRVQNHPEVIPSLMRRLLDYFVAHPRMADYEGQLFLVEAHRIRIRR